MRVEPDGSATVVEQYTYSPYGQIVYADILEADAPLSRVGFQGLFFDRFDSPRAGQTLAPAAGQPGGTSTAPTGLYYARNRFYSPALGRFVTRDVNATALPLLTLALRVPNGGRLKIARAEPTEMYPDGASLYAFVGNNPAFAGDPFGLFFGGFSELFGAASAREVLGGIGASALVSGVVGGIAEGILYRSIGAALKGFIVGAVAGAAGGAFAVPAFAASFSGVMAKLTVHVLANAAGGAVGAGLTAALEGGDLEYVLSAASFGALTGGMGGLLGCGIAARSGLVAGGVDADLLTEMADAVTAVLGVPGAIYWQYIRDYWTSH